MIKYLNIIILSLIVSFVGCSKKEEAAPVKKTGIELVAIGAVNYGGLVIGTYRDAAIRIYNYGPETFQAESYINTINNQKYVTFGLYDQSTEQTHMFHPVSFPDCPGGVILAGKNCTVSVRFQPLSQGSFSGSFKAGTASVPLTGRGMVDGVMSITETDWELGTVVAGDQYRRDITITNNGDFTIPSPTITVPNELTVGYNDCGSFLRALKECRVEIISNKTVAGTYNSPIEFKSGDLTLTVNYKATIKAAEPSGIILFENPPATIVADGQSEIVLQSQIITDRFNNPVADNTAVSVTGVNLTILTPKIQYTSGGKISFRLRSAASRGNSTITLISGEAVGVLRVKSIAGDPFGSISLESFDPNIVANGISQIVLKTLPMFDANGNIIEDGVPIYYSIEGIGTLSAPYSFSSSGTGYVVLTAPTTVGSAIVKIRSGPIYDENNNIVDYKAKGDFQINFNPGAPDGIIPISSTYSGIYALEDFAIEQQGINVRTQVAIGPIKDKNHNIVTNGTPIEVAVSGGKLLGVGSNPATFNTDSNGFVYILVAGNGARGPINITASHIQGATGTHMVWAYMVSTLYYDTSVNNKVTMFEKYYSALTLPSVNDNWGESKGYIGIGLSDDKNQYGQNITGFELYNSSTSILYKDVLPYISFDCWVSSQHYLILAPCQKNNDMTNEGPYAYDLYSVNNPSKIVNIAFDKQYNEAHNSHNPECEDYNQNYNTRPANKVNCEDEVSGGGATCRWDLNAYDGRILEYGKCVAKPLVNPGISYNEYTDQFLLYGGSFLKNPASYPSVNYYYENRGYSSIFTGLTRFGNQSAVSSQLGNESFEEVGSYPSTTSSMTEFTEKDNLHIGFGSYEQNIMCGIFNTQSLCDNTLPSVCEWNVGVGRCVDSYSLSEGVSPKPLITLNASSKKWESVTPDDDPVENEGMGFPTDRYSHGMVYIPELKMLYIAGGLRKYECKEFLSQSLCSNSTIAEQCAWDANVNTCKPIPNKAGIGYVQGSAIGLSDIWKVDMKNVDAFGSGSAEWKKICGSQKTTKADNSPNPANRSCLIPSPYNDLDRNPQATKVKTTMIWNNIRQKIYVYFSNNAKVLEINPYTDSITESTDGSQKLANYQQVIFNKQSGRMLGYSRGLVNQVNSKLYVWDLNPNEKKYYKVSFNLGAGSKNIAQELTPVIKAYGYTTNSTLPGNGVTAYIYNYSSNSWEFLGTNTASVASQMSGTEIYKTITTNVSHYISLDGFVNVLVTSNGNPNDGGRTALGIDQIKLDGKF